MATRTSRSCCRPASCSAARRADRCRRAPTTCSARRGCSARSSPRRVRAPRVLAVVRRPDVIGAPFYVMERVAGEVITDSVPDPLDTPEQRAPDRRRADRRAGRAARHRLERRRPRGLRQADRLPRAPAAPLQRAVGAQPHARAAPGRGGRRVARGEHPRVAAGDDRARRLPAREHDVRRRRAGAADRDLRLGDGDDRRSARRRRLHAHALDPAGRRPRQVQPEQRDAAGPGSPRAPS